MKIKNRKHPRLKNYDYSLPGFYYVTVCLKDQTARLSSVGRGLAPATVTVRLTEAGRIAENELLALEERHDNVIIDRYVIMPDHIHAIIRLTQTAGASPRPTLIEVVGAYKSLVTRKCNQQQATPGRRLFQASFYETVLRNEQAYVECCRYIEENPMKLLLGYHR